MSTQPKSNPRAEENLVSMQHIDKTFNPNSVNEVVLFRDFNLDIKKGQFVSVVGSKMCIRDSHTSVPR